MSMAGEQMQVVGTPVTLQKMPETDKFGNPVFDSDGKQKHRCGFRIGGGIDQDPTRSPQNYPDKGVYITYIEEGGAAAMCGLQAHDKILQVNGIDFTMVTHDKACKYIKKDNVLQMIVYRKSPDMFRNKAGPQQTFHNNGQFIHNGYQS